MSLQAMMPRDQIHARLQLIFPKGTPLREKCVSAGTASSIFTMLYIGAVAGNGVFLQPKHIYAMSQEQSEKVSESERLEYVANVRKGGFRAEGARWYQDNSREQLRDDGLREGLKQVGALDLQSGVSTTANKPRYALTPSFAALFDPALIDDELAKAIDAWQKANLTPGALARIALMLSGAIASKSEVLVTLPNKQTRTMSAGLSSVITKAVVEEFATRFLHTPAVIWISESGDKVIEHEDKLARRIGLQIEPDKELPDIILVDIGDGTADPLLVFVEVVHSDGPVSVRRKEALEAIAAKGGFPADRIAFVTAYEDKSKAPFKKTVNALAWGTYAWFKNEPNNIFQLSAKPFKIIGEA